jgi:hypothetical protein
MSIVGGGAAAVSPPVGGGVVSPPVVLGSPAVGVGSTRTCVLPDAV